MKSEDLYVARKESGEMLESVRRERKVFHRFRLYGVVEKRLNVVGNVVFCRFLD